MKILEHSWSSKKVNKGIEAGPQLGKAFIYKRSHK